MLIKTYSLRPHCVSCWTTYILQDDTWSLQCQVCVSCWTAYILQDDTRSLQCQVCVSCWTTYILQDDTRSLQCQVHKARLTVQSYLADNTVYLH